MMGDEGAEKKSTCRHFLERRQAVNADGGTTESTHFTHCQRATVSPHTKPLPIMHWCVCDAVDDKK